MYNDDANIVNFRAHEEQHVEQYRTYGPFYLPLYIINHPFSHKNSFEKEADEVGNKSYLKRKNDSEVD